MSLDCISGFPEDVKLESNAPVRLAWLSLVRLLQSILEIFKVKYEPLDTAGESEK